jgi:hypothetical protein
MLLFLNFSLPKGQLCFKPKRNEATIFINWKEEKNGGLKQQFYWKSTFQDNTFGEFK